MRKTIRRAAAAAALTISGALVMLPASTAHADEPVCTLPTVVSSAGVFNTSGQRIGTAELRRATVGGFLRKYYRFCSRVYLDAPRGPSTGTARVHHTVDGTTTTYANSAPITYVAPGSPSFATAGVSSPTIDVKRGTVAYSVSIRNTP
jgi:hypothetical protein